MDKIERVVSDHLPFIRILSVLFVSFAWDETRGLCMPLTATERRGGR